MLADVVNSQEVRVIQRGNRPGLLFKATEPIGVASKGLRQNFDRDLSAQAGIPAAVHLAHAARAKQRHDLVRAEALAWC